MFVQGISAMIRLSTIAAAFCLASLLFSQPSYTQAKSEIERLYILNCGEGVAGDISRWSPGVNVGKPMDFVDSCYLIKHAQGWLLWDTGVTDAISAMPDVQKPSDPSATDWKRPKTSSVLLSGDAVHFKSNWENRGVPSMNVDKDKTTASMQRMADIMAKEKAQLWINHDKAQRDTMKMAPDFYD